MNDKLKPSGTNEQPVSGFRDDRAEAHRASAPPRDKPDIGTDGPIGKDAQGYRTHYGETAYGGGQKRYGDQPPVTKAEAGVPRDGDAGRAEGKAGSKATLPGAGADKGPPDGK